MRDKQEANQTDRGSVIGGPVRPVVLPVGPSVRAHHRPLRSLLGERGSTRPFGFGWDNDVRLALRGRCAQAWKGILTFMTRHLFAWASAAVVIAVVYIVIVITTSTEIAAGIGVGYISVIITISFFWELAHRRDHGS